MPSLLYHIKNIIIIIKVSSWNNTEGKMMLDMTPLFSWYQWNLQFSQISSQISAINCCAFPKMRLNYVSARQRGLPLDT